MEDHDFAARIRERYPEGLTGIFAIGGTRTTYILEKNRGSSDPGKINSFSEQDYLLDRYCQMMQMFYGLGGQNMIITASSFRGFTERGSEYALLVTKELLKLAGPWISNFYRENKIDPYFIGIEAFLQQPADDETHKMAQFFIDFQKNWAYTEGHYKLIWEIASMPLLSFWKMFQSLSEQERTAFDAELSALTNLDDLYKRLYEYFAQKAYGAKIPTPHFYLGTNKSGDLKWRSPMPIALSGGEYMRMFYTPYPSLFTTRETLHSILNDLAFKDRFASFSTDYSGKYSPELVSAEYERVMKLSSQPETTLGFARKVNANQNA